MVHPRVLKETKVFKVLKVLMGHHLKVLKGVLEYRVLKVLKEIKVLKESRVLKVVLHWVH